MALPSTGTLSLGQVNTELGKAATAAISLGDAAVRTLAGKASGAVSLGDLRGKSAEDLFAQATLLVGKYTNESNIWLGQGGFASQSTTVGTPGALTPKTLGTLAFAGSSNVWETSTLCSNTTNLFAGGVNNFSLITAGNQVNYFQGKYLKVGDLPPVAFTTGTYNTKYLNTEWSTAVPGVYAYLLPLVGTNVPIKILNSI